MKQSLLLLMTPGMSLERWEKIGQLARELNYYKTLCDEGGFNLLIYSYGRSDDKYLTKYPQFVVLNMPGWILSNLPFRVQNLVYNFWSLFKYGKFFKQSILIKTNQFSASLFGLLIRWIYGVPLLVRMGYYYSHFKRPGFFGRLEEAVVFKFCDSILVTSSEASKYISTSYKVPSKKILYMCNAIDLNIFRPENRRKDFDLIFIGRLEDQKNIVLLTEVLSTLSLKSLIIGEGSKMPFVVDAMKENPKISWIDKVENSALPDYYNSARCFILLSEYEGNPKVLLEAMACGLPVVGMDSPGIRECVTTDFNGVIVNADDVRHQISLLFDSPDNLARLGANALEWVNDACDKEKNVKREISHYRCLQNFEHFVISKQKEGVC